MPRWVETSNKPRSSAWPCTSTRIAPTSRRKATPTGSSLTKARVRPSAASVRRRTISLSTAMDCSARSAWAPLRADGSKTAVAEPWAAPGRTDARPRPPAANPKASRRIDLPAPVSPVRTFRPGANSSAAASIKTMSRTVSAASIDRPFESLAQDSGYPRALVNLRLQMMPLQELVGVLVPGAAGIIVAQHGGRGFRFAVDTQRIVGLGQTLQGFGDLRGLLILLDDRAKAVDGADIIALVEVVAADRHFLARQMIERQVDLERCVAGIFGIREALDDVLQRRECAFGARLVAADIDDLLVERDRLQVEGVCDFFAARMKCDVLIGGADGIIIMVGMIIAVGRHQHGATRPDRIGMLALDLVELLGGKDPIAVADLFPGIAVDLVDRPFDVFRFLGLIGALADEVVHGIATGEAHSQYGDDENRSDGPSGS